jgi:hypothetical protein
MKFIFLVGGLLGFLCAAGTGWVAGRASDRVLLDGALGALGGALLFRWFWTVLLEALRQTLVARQEAAVAAAAAAAAANPERKPKTP